jgi:phage shock protein C
MAFVFTVQMPKKLLYRSTKNRVLAGVLGGLGEYLDIDPVVLRLIFVLLWAVTGFLPLLLAYVIWVFVVPKR